MWLGLGCQLVSERLRSCHRDGSGTQVLLLCEHCFKEAPPVACSCRACEPPYCSGPSVSRNPASGPSARQVQTRAGPAQNAQPSAVLRCSAALRAETTLQGDIPWPYEARDGVEFIDVGLFHSARTTEFNIGTCHANMSPFRSSTHRPEDVVHPCCMPALWVSVRCLLLLVGC